MTATDIRILKKCKLCLTLGKDHVPSEGKPSCDIMIIGQSPGATEVEEERPFVGPCGEILDYMLDEAGISRDEVYITNALKCRPPGNRPGHSEELECCMNTWLVQEIKQVNPMIIVLVGKDAWKSVTKERIPFEHGKVHRRKKRMYLTVYHPGYFLRSGDITAFVSVGKTLKELIGDIP
jgi:uracil-DNA glycosylase family 4